MSSRVFVTILCMLLVIGWALLKLVLMCAAGIWLGTVQARTHV